MPLKGFEHQLSCWFDGWLIARYGASPDASQIAIAATDLWHSIAEELQSIIGNQGFAALFNRSQALTARTHPWFEGAMPGEDQGAAFNTLRSLLAQQSDGEAARGAHLLLRTFWTILASLVGSALCEQLLLSVQCGSSSGGLVDPP
jgi:hypothetical protein